LYIYDERFQFFLFEIELWHTSSGDSTENGVPNVRALVADAELTAQAWTPATCCFGTVAACAIAIEDGFATLQSGIIIWCFVGTQVPGFHQQQQERRKHQPRCRTPVTTDKVSAFKGLGFQQHFNRKRQNPRQTLHLKKPNCMLPALARE
jgi:hypothetical protein